MCYPPRSSWGPANEWSAHPELTPAGSRDDPCVPREHRGPDYWDTNPVSATSKISPIFLALLGVTVLGGLLCAFGTANKFLLGLGAILLVFGGYVVTLCLHEFGHAITAFRGGDWAVRGKGYLNLDPRRYTDPVLSLLLPLLILAIGGIPLPGGAVWINHHALRNKKVESAVSVAGPAANLVVAIVLTLAVALGFRGATLSFGSISLGAALTYLAMLQILTFIINILPIPGLDGWGAIEPWLPYQAQEFGRKVRPWAPLGLFVILIAIPPAVGVLYQIVGFILQAFGGSYELALIGQQLAMPWR